MTNYDALRVQHADVAIGSLIVIGHLTGVAKLALWRVGVGVIPSLGKSRDK